MSLGYAGGCHKELEDEKTVIYSYWGEDFNLPKDKAASLKAKGGMFTIQKSALEEPEIHIKRQRISKHRKGFVEKRIPHLPHIAEHIEDGGVTVDKLCAVDELEKGEGNHPRVVYSLLTKVFMSYMQDGIVPEDEYFLQ